MMKKVRFLIVRTDRIGDVVLSTPVVSVLRQARPDSYIAMMVSPFTVKLIEGSKLLDRIVVFDKKRYRGLFGSMRFAIRLRRMRFDVALILHPTRRVHILLWLAGIPRRIGWDRKYGFLLTDRIPHKKHLGKKHEVEYNLELLNYIGITPSHYEPKIFVNVDKKDRDLIDSLLMQNNINKRNMIVFHPGASCPSKRWSPGDFASVADTLIERDGFDIVVVAGEDNVGFVEDMLEHMRNRGSVLSLAGKIHLGQLSALLEDSLLLVSNDSGPVHIAVAHRTGVVVVFGRKQPGLGYLRWGPYSDKRVIIHKDVGCEECLAHRCKNGFKCLEAISPKEVLDAVYSLLGRIRSEVGVVK